MKKYIVFSLILLTSLAILCADGDATKRTDDQFTIYTARTLPYGKGSIEDQAFINLARILPNFEGWLGSIDKTAFPHGILIVSAHENLFDKKANLGATNPKDEKKKS
ncbi:hypothetical protein EBQ93_03810 [bacterium]|nr:hypothetical protein [bacterium]